MENQSYKTNRRLAGIAMLVAFLAIGFVVQMPGKGTPDICLNAWMLEMIPGLFSQWKSGDHAPNMFIAIGIILILWVLVAVAIGWAIGKLPAVRKDSR